MMIKTINTLVTNSTVLAVLEDLHNIILNDINIYYYRQNEASNSKHSSNAKIQPFQGKHKFVTELLIL